MKIKYLFVLAAILTLTGCSEYMLQSNKEMTYTESLTPGVYKVTFCGNAFMDEQEVEKYAMQRACEMTLNKGYTHFIIEARDDQSQSCYLSQVPVQGYPGRREEMPYSSTSGSQKMERPNLTLTIRCYKQAKAPNDAIDAQKYLDKNFPGLQLKK